MEKFYAEHVCFVTGATGFVGKVLVEKLLRWQPTGPPIYVLIRPRQDESAADRLHREARASAVLATLLLFLPALPLLLLSLPSLSSVPFASDGAVCRFLFSRIVARTHSLTRAHAHHGRSFSSFTALWFAPPKQIIASPIFTRLKKEIGEETFFKVVARRLRAVEGDLLKQNVGLAPDMYARLQREVSIVLHIAASVNFNADLVRLVMSWLRLSDVPARSSSCLFPNLLLFRSTTDCCTYALSLGA